MDCVCQLMWHHLFVGRAIDFNASDEADGVFFGEFEDVAGGGGDGGGGVGEFLAVELDGAGGDELFAEFAVGFFEVEGGFEGVGGEGEDGEVGGEGGDFELGEVGGGEVFFGEAGVPIGAGCGSGIGAVVAGGESLGEGLFGVHGVGGGIACLT